MKITCPIGLDASPQYCSARTCSACCGSDAAARAQFCTRCNFGPLFSWEKREVGCAYCEHRPDVTITQTSKGAE